MRRDWFKFAVFGVIALSTALTDKVLTDPRTWIVAMGAVAVAWKALDSSPNKPYNGS